MAQLSRQLPKPVVTIATILFVLVSIPMIWFCYSGYAYALDAHFNPWVAVALICVTVLFRLDIITALIGFYGAWKGEGPHFYDQPSWLHTGQPLPMWEALLISLCFIGLSFVVNYSTRLKTRSGLIRGLWRRNQTVQPTYVPGTALNNQRPVAAEPVTPPVTPESAPDYTPVTPPDIPEAGSPAVKPKRKRKTP